MGATTTIVMYYEAHDCQTWDHCYYLVGTQSLNFHFGVRRSYPLPDHESPNNIITLFSFVTSLLVFLMFSKCTIKIHGAELGFRDCRYVCSTSPAEAIDGREEH